MHECKNAPLSCGAKKKCVLLGTSVVQLFCMKFDCWHKNNQGLAAYSKTLSILGRAKEEHKWCSCYESVVSELRK